MRFDTRELKDYADPVSMDSLQIGQEYFSVQYANEAMLIPVVETWVYVGTDLDNTESGLLYFQDVESYRDGVRYDSAESEGAMFQVGEPGKINHIFEFDHALNELLKCSIRRNRSS